MSICSQVCRVVVGKVTGACVRDAIDGGDAVSGRGRWKFCIAFYLMIIMILIMTPSRWSRSLQLLYRGPIWKLTADWCSAQCAVFKLTTLEAFKLRRPVSTRIVLELIELVAGFVWPDNCGVNCKKIAVFMFWHIRPIEAAAHQSCQKKNIFFYVFWIGVKWINMLDAELLDRPLLNDNG